MFKYNTALLDEISALPIVNDLVTIQDMMRWGYSYCIEPLKLRNKRIIGIWRNFSGISETEVLKTGALRCIAPLFYVEKSKNNELRKNG